MKITINGKSQNFDGDPETPLLWVLRDSFQLTGTKFGCGKGLCGACTVHVNGTPFRSCVTAIRSVQGQNVTTIEGLSTQGNHPVQLAWIAEDVPQCGYCQAGQIMTAAWLLSHKADPSDADIDQAMSGNLCRCATYIRIRRAIHKSAQIKRAKE